MNDYYTELANRDKATKPVKIVGTEEISYRCPNDDYEVGWGVPDEELDLMYSFCPECGQRMDWEGKNIEKAIEYFYNQMERGLIENDTQQEVYETAISVLEKTLLNKGR